MTHPFTIRPFDPASERELNHLCVFSTMTLWESRPELRVDPDSIADFGFEAHRKLYLAGADQPNTKSLIALDKDAKIVGHSVVVLRHKEGQPYGYFWSRYVLPQYRRQGLARTFLKEALSWFQSQGASWAEVHIHVENGALRGMFESEGFSVIDRRTDRWTYLVLRKDLS